jgi:hypothetical protein
VSYYCGLEGDDGQPVLERMLNFRVHVDGRAALQGLRNASEPNCSCRKTTSSMPAAP